MLPVRFEFLSEEIKNLTADILAEVLSAELINNGVRPDDIVFKSVGLRKRPYSRDILGIEFPDDDEKIQIAVHRESLYDSLPEALFHQPLNSKPFKSKEEVLNEIKIHRQEEKEARKFFLPLENEFHHLRLLLEQTERKSFDNFSGKSTMQVFYKLFGVVSFLNPEQIATLLILLPRAYQLKGNLKLLEQCYTLILGENIKIGVHKKRESTILENSIDNSFLGINSLTNNELRIEEEFIKIEVEIKDERRILLYMKDGENNKIINLLNDYFLPYDLNVEVDLNIFNKEKLAGIGNDATPSFLGANTYI